MVRLPDGTDDAEVHRKLAAHGIHAPALSEYAHSAAGRPFPGLVLGYAASSPDRLRAAVSAMAEVTGR